MGTRAFLTALSLFAALPALAEAAPEEGFVSLFDGHSLKGWHATTENADSFSVKNGEIVVKGERAHLFYDGSVNGGTFKNFELRAKVLTKPGANSGVYFLTRYQAEGWPEVGFEAQVNSTHTDPRKTGSLYAVADIYAPGPGAEPFGVRFKDNDIFVWRDKAPSTDDQWFDYTVIRKDRNIVIKVDGVTMVDWTMPEDWKGRGYDAEEGTFALQAHDPNSEIHYKDIRVKVLD